MSVLIAAETVVLVLLTVLVAGLLRSHGEILRRLHALDDGGDADAVSPALELQAARTGRRAHDITGAGLDDQHVHVAVAGTRHRTLLAFLSSGCLTCANFWDAFAGDDLGLPPDVRLVIVTKSEHEESPAAIRSLATPRYPVVMASDAWAEYSVPGSPYFVIVDGLQGRVEGEGTGATWAQIHNLMLQAGADGSAGAAREARIDRELLAHGIGPGDPRLYHDGSAP